MSWRSWPGTQELGEGIPGQVGSMGGHRGSCDGGAGVLEERQAVQHVWGVEGGEVDWEAGA